MIQEAVEIYNRMNSKLEVLKGEFNTLIPLAERSIEVVKQAIVELEMVVKDYSFDNELSQISFYKHTSPYFYEKYIYFVAIYNIEASRPDTDIKGIDRYYRKAIKKLQRFYLDNSDFYKYSRAGKTYLDGLYFTKESQEQFTIDAFDPAINKKLFTLYSIRLATLLAYEQVNATFKTAVNKNQGGVLTRPGENNKLEWTDSKTGLTELIYAWKERGSFNNGRASIQQITDYLENVFGVNLGNTSRTYQQTLFRKSGPTTYLDELRNDAQKRADRL